jgi:hypothetical protein
MRDWIRGKVEDLKLLVGEWLPLSNAYRNVVTVLVDNVDRELLQDVPDQSWDSDDVSTDAVPRRNFILRKKTMEEVEMMGVGEKKYKPNKAKGMGD